MSKLPALLPTDVVAIGQLLPDCWAQAHPEHVLVARLEESRAAAEQRRQRRSARRLLTQA